MKYRTDLSLVGGKPLWIRPLIKARFARKLQGREVARFGSVAQPLAIGFISARFFTNPDDEYRVLLPFIKDGLACGEKAVHTIDPQRRDEHLQRLASAGIDVTGASQSGQFEIHNKLSEICRSEGEYYGTGAWELADH